MRKGRTRRNVLIAGAAAVGMALLLFVGWMWWAGYQQSASQDRAHALLASVPIGAEREQIAELLNRAGVSNGPGEGDTWQAMVTGGASMTVRTDYQLIFEFNPDGELVRSRIEEVYTGP